MKAILEMTHPRKCYEEPFMVEDHRSSERNSHFLLVRDGYVKEISIGLFFKLRYNELVERLALGGRTFSSMQPPQLSSLIKKKWESEGDQALKIRRFLFALEDTHEQFLLCSCLPMIVPNSSAEIDILYNVGIEQETESLLIYDQNSRAITHCNQQCIDTFGLDETVVKRMKKDSVYAQELFEGLNLDDPRTLKKALNQEPIYCNMNKKLELSNRNKIQMGVVIELIARFTEQSLLILRADSTFCLKPTNQNKKGKAKKTRAWKLSELYEENELKHSFAVELE